MLSLGHTKLAGCRPDAIGGAIMGGERARPPSLGATNEGGGGVRFRFEDLGVVGVGVTPRRAEIWPRAETGAGDGERAHGAETMRGVLVMGPLLQPLGAETMRGVRGAGLPPPLEDDDGV